MKHVASTTKFKAIFARKLPNLPQHHHNVLALTEAMITGEI